MNVTNTLVTLGIIAAVFVGFLTWIAMNRLSRENQNTSNLFDKFSDNIKPNLRKITFGIIGLVTVGIIWWALTIQIVQDFFFTEIVITVAAITIITIIALLLLGLSIIFIPRYRKHRLDTSKYQPETETRIAGKERFLPIPISSIGNKYLNELYIDPPKGDEVLKGVKFEFQPQSLVFDTYEQKRNYKDRDDGSIEVALNLVEPIQFIKSAHFLINSGNSKTFYKSRKIGAIELIFKDVHPLITELILGENIREWCIGARAALVRETSNPLSTKVWDDSSKDGTRAVIDNLEIEVSKKYNVLRNCTLVQINFIHNQLKVKEDTLGVQYFVSAITVETDPSFPTS